MFLAKLRMFWLFFIHLYCVQDHILSTIGDVLSQIVLWYMSRSLSKKAHVSFIPLWVLPSCDQLIHVFNSHFSHFLSLFTHSFIGGERDQVTTL
jgi:hypothetical protein